MKADLFSNRSMGNNNTFAISGEFFLGVASPAAVFFHLRAAKSRWWQQAVTVAICG
jgi:hypothetical protein